MVRRGAAPLTVAIVGSYLVARYFLTPNSFREYGWYRGEALGEIASRPPVYAGKKACDECHSEILEKLAGVDRDAGRTNQTATGARRRSVITSVLESLRVNLPTFTLQNVVDEAIRWMKHGISLFKRQLHAVTSRGPVLENTS